MVEKAVFLYLLDDNKSVIYKSSPEGRGCGAVLMACFSKASIYMLAIMGLSGDSIDDLWQQQHQMAISGFID